MLRCYLSEVFTFFQFNCVIYLNVEIIPEKKKKIQFKIFVYFYNVFKSAVDKKCWLIISQGWADQFDYSKVIRSWEGEEGLMWPQLFSIWSEDNQSIQIEVIWNFLGQKLTSTQ